jgi:hypothetical protein
MDLLHLPTVMAPVSPEQCTWMTTTIDVAEDAAWDGEELAAVAAAVVIAAVALAASVVVIV